MMISLFSRGYILSNGAISINRTFLNGKLTIEIAWNTFCLWQQSSRLLDYGKKMVNKILLINLCTSRGRRCWQEVADVLRIFTTCYSFKAEYFKADFSMIYYFVPRPIQLDPTVEVIDFIQHLWRKYDTRRAKCTFAASDE